MNKTDLQSLLESLDDARSLLMMVERHRKKLDLRLCYRPLIHFTAQNGLDGDLLHGEMRMMIRRMALLFSLPQRCVKQDVTERQQLLHNAEEHRGDREVETLENMWRLPHQP